MFYFDLSYVNFGLNCPICSEKNRGHPNLKNEDILQTQKTVEIPTFFDQFSYIFLNSHFFNVQFLLKISIFGTKIQFLDIF